MRVVVREQVAEGLCEQARQQRREERRLRQQRRQKSHSLFAQLVHRQHLWSLLCGVGVGNCVFEKQRLFGFVD